MLSSQGTSLRSAFLPMEAQSPTSFKIATAFPPMQMFPETLKVIARENLPNVAQILVQAQTLNEFRKLLQKITPEHLSKIAELTIGQSDTTDWFYYRQGVVTATLTKRICTNAKKGEGKNHKIDASISKLGDEKLFYPAILYGRTMEPNAVKCFFETFKNTHEKAKLLNVGFKLHQELKIIGGSADGVLQCDCDDCPKNRILEVKCPYRLKGQSIQKNWKILEYLTPNCELKQNHEYHYQIQTYLGLYGYSEAILLIWSEIDYITIKVKFDSAMWNLICESTVNYYYKFYAQNYF